ncbi:MAG: RdgB/HAM1 family non-canonical purine NTP pyrophosphatase [Coprothermobacterota bacterium]|nr:RdgB/HAM1 family non-canonical purine NTP pyrophosphatase [Coprothermobacterota bacterium]
MTLLCATNNAHKLKEISNILSNLPVKILSLNDFPWLFLPAECGNSYEENALLKARQVFYFTGFPSLSDDTGIEVETLGGRPGIFSSRYADSDAERRRKLLFELQGLPWEKRRAKFVCVVAFVSNEGEHLFRGEVPGFIAFEERGTNGFGYDPIFFLPEVGRTYGEMSEDEKNKLSHRSRALTQFRKWLEENSGLFLSVP